MNLRCKVCIMEIAIETRYPPHPRARSRRRKPSSRSCRRLRWRGQHEKLLECAWLACVWGWSPWRPRETWAPQPYRGLNQWRKCRSLWRFPERRRSAECGPAPKFLARARTPTPPLAFVSSPPPLDEATLIERWTRWHRWRGTWFCPTWFQIQTQQKHGSLWSQWFELWSVNE